MRKNMFFFAVVSFFILTTLLLGSCTDFDADVMAASAPEKPEIPEEDEEFIEWTYAFSEGISAETVLDSIQGEDEDLNQYFIDYIVTVNDKYEATYMGETLYKDSVRTIKLSEVADAAFRNLDLWVSKGYTYYQKSDNKAYDSFPCSNTKEETTENFSTSGWDIQKVEKNLTLRYENMRTYEDTLIVKTTSAGFAGMYTDPQSGLSVSFKDIAVAVTQDYKPFHSKDDSFIYDEENAEWVGLTWDSEDVHHNTVMRDGVEYLRYPFFSKINFIVRMDGEEVTRPTEYAQFEYYIRYNAQADIDDGNTEWRN